MSTIAKGKDPQRNAVIACAGLVAVSLALVAFGRGERTGPVLDPDTVAGAVDLKFDDMPDGTVVARNAATGAEIERLAPGEGGFIRVTMRSFAGERQRRGLGDAEPFTLARTDEGGLFLQDPATGRTMLLTAFGPSNAGVFAELLDHGRNAR